MIGLVERCFGFAFVLVFIVVGAVGLGGEGVLQGGEGFEFVHGSVVVEISIILFDQRIKWL